jgi:hypothetical protein
MMPLEASSEKNRCSGRIPSMGEAFPDWRPDQSRRPAAAGETATTPGPGTTTATRSAQSDFTFRARGGSVRASRRQHRAARIVVAVDEMNEAHRSIYLVRLVAYAVFLVAIVDKNRVDARNP